MSLAGTLDTMPAAELIAWLAQREHTGILTFKQSENAKILTIESSQVTNAASSDLREHLGQYLINYGLIEDDQLRKAFDTQKETNVFLGKILVMTGVVTEEQIKRMLELKIRETTLDFFLWDLGEFEFHDSMIPDVTSAISVSVDLQKLYQEGLVRRRHYQEIRRHIPHNECRFLCNKDIIPTTLNPTSSDAVLVDLARKGLTAEEIIHCFHSMDYLILNNLYELIHRGWLSVKESPSPDNKALPEVDVDLEEPSKPTGPEAFLLQAESAIGRRDYARAVEILQAGLVEHPYDPDLCDALETAKRGLNR
jgi:hypothetical protein